VNNRLIKAHGGKLVNLLVDESKKIDLKARSKEWVSWNLTNRQMCDLELLMNGGFSPLQGFLAEKDYEAVCRSMTLADNTLWTIPITLDVSEDFAKELKPGQSIALRDPEGTMLAVLHVEDVWKPDKKFEADAVYGTTNLEHSGVAYLMDQAGSWYVGGRIEGIQLPVHYDFKNFRNTPEELRDSFRRAGWRNIVAFQTGTPIHREHRELTLRAAMSVEASLLLHPAVGMTNPGDLDHYTRVRCYKAVLRYYPQHTVKLSLLPLAMRMAGPREALWHAIIRKNYGCTHLIVGRDHASPGNDSSGKPFYEEYEAQELMKKHEEVIGIKSAPFKSMSYLSDYDAYVSEDEIPKGSKTQTITDSDLRDRLVKGRKIPEWFTYPTISEELQKSYPPLYKRGFTVFLTGLSGSGKSTIAQVILNRLLEDGDRPVTLLDGDIVRKNLSSQLGFSKEHRNINILRIGFVASEITKNNGIAICAPIAPYKKVRNEVRQKIEEYGGFFLVHLSTPLEVCEQRDRKGLYAKARAGIIKEFTGISDPYEVPDNPDVTIDTSERTPEEAAQEIMLHISRLGYINVTGVGKNS